MNRQELMQQLAEAYVSIQQIDIKATADNIAALGKALGLMRYVYEALNGITEEAVDNVSGQPGHDGD